MAGVGGVVLRRPQRETIIQHPCNTQVLVIVGAGLAPQASVQVHEVGEGTGGQQACRARKGGVCQVDGDRKGIPDCSRPGGGRARASEEAVGEVAR